MVSFERNHQAIEHVDYRFFFYECYVGLEHLEHFLCRTTRFGYSHYTTATVFIKAG